MAHTVTDYPRFSRERMVVFGFQKRQEETARVGNSALFCSWKNQSGITKPQEHESMGKYDKYE
jgi:hypothetical protein